MKGGLNGTGVLAVAGLAAAGLLLWRYRGVIGSAAGIVSGNNALTQGATNAQGQRTTAYEGVPVIGTLGAGANAVTGGRLASFGEWLGGKVYDLTHSDGKASAGVIAPQTTTGDFARLDRASYYRAGASGSGSMVDTDLPTYIDPMTGWAP